MDDSQVPEGIDPKFACRIEIIVNSYFSIIDGKKVYTKGRTVSWVVDSEEYAIIELEKDIAQYFTWANNQKAIFWVVDSRLNRTGMLATDSQLLDLLRASQVVKLFMTVGAREEGHVVGEATNDAPNVVDKGANVAPSMVDDGTSPAANVVEEEMKAEGFEWAEVPTYGETTAGPPMAEEEEKEHFTGKYNGQLAAATAIDGHNWMYPVAYGIFGKENNANWAWFMRNLKKAVGTPPGLTIHSDACKGLAYGVKKAFGHDAEHRECFRHLMANFRKKFKGEVLKYMWPCAWACTTRRHDALMEKIAADCPKAIAFLNKHHNLIWSRSKFSKECKIDYVNNNISECFNNWIKDYKDLPVDYLMDKIRQMIQEKMCTRQVIANRLEGVILPSVLHELNMKSRGLHYELQKSGPLSGEISGTTKEGKTWRYAVDLEKRECGCGQWEVSGKPCPHAIYLIGKVRQLKNEDFVHDYYSVERFKMAYQFKIAPMSGRSEWPKVDVGFEVIPPPLQRAAGRPRKRRIKASGEPGKRGPYQCKRCFQFGHIEKGCTATQAELEQELPPPRPKKGKKARKSKSEDVEASTTVVEPTLLPHSSPGMTTGRATLSPISPGVTTRRMASLSPISPGVTTRRMASLSPTSPGVTTRRMAAISPGGISRRIIIE